jgi:predicted enzyme related to lactoylglutathione lyase
MWTRERVMSASNGCARWHELCRALRGMARQSAGEGAQMFRNTQAFSSFSVNDSKAAKKFYGETLELEVSEQKEGLAVKISGGGNVFIYEKSDHMPASFTILNFPVDDVEAAVAELKRRGVQFEIYTDGDVKTDPSGIFRDPNGPTIAWFKDPAGNFLSVLKPS